MNTKHLNHVDQLRINRDRSDTIHKVRAIVNAIREKFFVGEIWYTVGETDDSVHIHVLENKSHRNAVKGIQEAADNRFGVNTEIVDQDSYKTVLQFDI